jgi:isoquinoline 1-oxidoreductase beta subunit
MTDPDGNPRQPTPPDPTFDRRDVLRAAGVGGGILFVMFGIPTIAGQIPRPQEPSDAPGPAVAPLRPNAYVSLDVKGIATLTIPNAEMGQGIQTAIAMLIAEELDLPLHRVRVRQAPADDALFANPAFGFQATGGSTSIRTAFEPMRRAGATVRALLVGAAAENWRVDIATCRTERGAVVHDASGRRFDYGLLVAAASKRPMPEKLSLKNPADYKLIGTPAKRLDGAEKISGKAIFGIDVRLPGLKVAALAICPHIGGHLAKFDAVDALKVRGVRQIVSTRDTVAVVADHMGAARKGLAALTISWDRGLSPDLSSAALAEAMREAASRDGVVAETVGDASAAIAGAANRIEALYEMPLLAHATMEPLNCTVHVRPDACDVWVGSQIVSRARAAAAKVTGLPLSAVTVHNHPLGGGFGRRLEEDYVTRAVEIAKQVEGPLKVVWSREEDMRNDLFRPHYVGKLFAGLDAAGRPVGFSHRVVGPSIVARWIPPGFAKGLDADIVDGASGPYGWPTRLVDFVRHEGPDAMAPGWWRGVGVTRNAFMVESFVDELAVLAGRDPLAFRLDLLGKEPRAAHVLSFAAEKAGWGTALPPGRGRGLSVLFGFGTYLAQVVEVEVDTTGSVRVRRVACAVDCGQPVNPDTIRAQMEGGVIFGLTAALHGEITIVAGQVQQSNFDGYRMMRIDEAPLIETHVVDSREAPGGMGEPGTAGIAPALVNAIYAVTGRRLRKLPVGNLAGHG